MESNYLLAPKANHGFICKIPMKGTRQVYVVNGHIQGNEGGPLALSFPKGECDDTMLQVIFVRTTGESGKISGICMSCAPSEKADDGGAIELDTASSIEFGEDCSKKLLLCSHTFTPDRFLTRERCEINVRRGANADITVMQNENNRSVHLTDYTINMEEGSALKMIFISLHGGKISNKLKVNLNGEHIDCNLKGLCLADGEQHMDTEVLMEHYKPNCNSNQLFKYILDDKAIADFYGLIRVAQDAQKTNAYQANHNLLISDYAKVHTKPQLEIYADDVKCSHGATVGRLNEDELFYMRSRGISLHEAQLLQQKAFANGVLEGISSRELRLRMESLVDSRLRGEFSSCRNCSKNCC
ncbi:MAG: Fe-S cluster assembly protein SufD [Bacteroidales bacterium]|jgi:Fe-S cluster assembly protein SufD|nr:Fe-S cluster assembly protein SufD [Bacteroidales bacterium]MCI2121751.1 Fe-S cluster assembly protein SufD [Bacteroidales bacterium]MCI2146364.1 Fe-S cluster assembly protein SufD [Bacteroidales bacterium]